MADREDDQIALRSRRPVEDHQLVDARPGADREARDAVGEAPDLRVAELDRRATFDEQAGGPGPRLGLGGRHDDRRRSSGSGVRAPEGAAHSPAPRAAPRGTPSTRNPRPSSTSSSARRRRRPSVGGRCGGTPSVETIRPVPCVATAPVDRAGHRAPPWRNRGPGREPQDPPRRPPPPIGTAPRRPRHRGRAASGPCRASVDLRRVHRVGEVRR